MKISDLQIENRADDLLAALARAVERGGRHRFPSSGDVALRLARLATEMDAPAVALEAWRAAFEAADDPAAAHECAAGIARQTGSAGFLADRFPELIPLIEGALDRAAPPDMAGVRHVAICGVSYCGSTMMDRVLGSLPGVLSIGESHWLAENRDFQTRGSRLEPIPWWRDDPGRIVNCWICGRGCPVLTRDFRAALSAFRDRWYFRIAGQLDTRTLISADKNLAKYVRLDPLLRFDALVLAKTPAQAWRSHRDNIGIAEDRFETEIPRYLDRWSREYDDFLRLRNRGRRHVCILDDFAADPAGGLAALCGALDLPFAESALVDIRLSHAIGGNGRSARELRESQGDFRIRPLDPPALSDRERRLIDAHAPAAETMTRLRNWTTGGG